MINITQILLLLQMAASLLTAVQQNTDLPPSFRQQAVSTANFAIQVASNAVKELATVQQAVFQTHPVTPQRPPFNGRFITQPTAVVNKNDIEGSYYATIDFSFIDAKYFNMTCSGFLGSPLRIERSAARPPITFRLSDERDCSGYCTIRNRPYKCSIWLSDDSEVGEPMYFKFRTPDY